MQRPCDLLKYIEYYRYTFETESVYIAENAERLEALDAYVRFAEEHGMKGDNLRLFSFVPKSPSPLDKRRLWVYNIRVEVCAAMRAWLGGGARSRKVRFFEL